MQHINWTCAKHESNLRHKDSLHAFYAPCTYITPTFTYLAHYYRHLYIALETVTTQRGAPLWDSPRQTTLDSRETNAQRLPIEASTCFGGEFFGAKWSVKSFVMVVIAWSSAAWVLQIGVGSSVIFQHLPYISHYEPVSSIVNDVCLNMTHEHQQLPIISEHHSSLPESCAVAATAVPLRLSSLLG